MNIGILKADDVHPNLVAQHGEYPDMFAALLLEVDPSLSFTTYDVYRQQYPATIDDVDAYLLTGSKHSVYEDLPWIQSLRGFIQQLDKNKKMLIGICFGHQMIADALGGRVEKSARGWGIGVREVFAQPNDSGPIDQNAFRIAYSHQDQVLEPAVNSVTLAGDAFCPCAATRKEQHILTLQGHPEFQRDYALGLLEIRQHLFDSDTYQQAVNSFTDEFDSQRQQVARWMLEFLR